VRYTRYRFFAVFSGVPKDVWGDAIGFSIPTGLTRGFVTIAEQATSIPPKTSRNQKKMSGLPFGGHCLVNADNG
jgi:hypothetical protein